MDENNSTNWVGDWYPCPYIDDRVNEWDNNEWPFHADPLATLSSPTLDDLFRMWQTPSYVPIEVWGEEYNWIWEITSNVERSGFDEEEEPVLNGMDYSSESGDSNLSHSNEKEDVYLFSLLPIELVCLIFEKAMDDNPWPIHLLLVSKQIKDWLEPFIYMHICITSCKKWKKFYRTFRNRQETSDISLFENNIRSLFVATGVNRSSQVVNVVKVLKNLRSLAIWDDNFGHKVLEVIFNLYDTQQVAFSIKNLDQGFDRDDHSETFKNNPYNHICRLSCSSSFLFSTHRSFDHATFYSITHLDIYFQENAPWQTLTSLKQLTHISFDLATLNSFTIDVIARWMKTLSSYCFSNVKVIIFGCVTTFEADFDILDSEGLYLPPGWFKPELDVFDLSYTPSSEVDVNDLHPFTQLCLGNLDPRAVAGCVTLGMPQMHLFQDLMIYFTWPDNIKDWDGTNSNHKECWTLAEEIIEKRKGLTYGDVVNRVASL